MRWRHRALAVLAGVFASHVVLSLAAFLGMGVLRVGPFGELASLLSAGPGPEELEQIEDVLRRSAWLTALVVLPLASAVAGLVVRGVARRPSPLLGVAAVVPLPLLFTPSGLTRLASVVLCCVVAAVAARGLAWRGRQR